MAAMEKYTDSMVLYKLRHVTRESGKFPSNIDIDHNLSGKNYSLAPPDRGTTARENKRYYNKRMKEIYKYGRSDVNTAVQWVITAPKDLPAEQEKAFFTESYRYLNSLYGEKNCIQCVVHVDEGVRDRSGNHIAGSHHMHYTFIPAVQNKSYMTPNKKGTSPNRIRLKKKFPLMRCSPKNICSNSTQTINAGWIPMELTLLFIPVSPEEKTGQSQS